MTWVPPPWRFVVDAIGRRRTITFLPVVYSLIGRQAGSAVDGKTGRIGRIVKPGLLLRCDPVLHGWEVAVLCQIH